jgi:hypothetical protein
MNFVALLRLSWQLTWQHKPLWLLALALVITLAPALLLSGVFGALASLTALSAMPGLPPDALGTFLQLPTWLAWVLGLASLAGLLATTPAAWLVQGAMLRGVNLAVEQGQLTLAEACCLGRTRARRLVGLGLLAALLSALVSLTPPSILLAAPHSAAAKTVANLSQTGLAPVNIALSLAIMLVMLSTALEEPGAQGTLRRAWGVFQRGWVNFVAVFLLSALVGGLLGLVLGLVLAPLGVVVGLSLAWGTQWGMLLGLGCCALTSPVGLALLLFTTIFTQALYTLVYRSAASPRQAAGENHP